MKFLDSERNEGRELEDIAKDIVNGFHEALSKGLDKPVTPIRPGMLVKVPWDGKVWRVGWLANDELWLVGETSAYGWLGWVSEPEKWRYCEEYRPKKRVLVDGKGKMLEMSDEDIAEAWSNPDYQVGDKLSLQQRVSSFEVIATGPKCALMRNTETGGLVADSNANLDKHYHREVTVNVAEVEW